MQKSYVDLEVWQQRRKLVNTMYELTKSFPKEEIYGLTQQIRRCAVSIPSNIAEGCGRQHAKDSIQFYYIARGSLYELETQLYLAFDQKFIQETDLTEILESLTYCKKLLNGFINHYKTL